MVSSDTSWVVKTPYELPRLDVRPTRVYVFIVKLAFTDRPVDGRADFSFLESVLRMSRMQQVTAVFVRDRLSTTTSTQPKP